MNECRCAEWCGDPQERVAGHHPTCSEVTTIMSQMEAAVRSWLDTIRYPGPTDEAKDVFSALIKASPAASREAMIKYPFGAVVEALPPNCSVGTRKHVALFSGIVFAHCTDGCHVRVTFFCDMDRTVEVPIADIHRVVGYHRNVTPDFMRELVRANAS